MKVILFSTQWPEYMISLANELSSHADVYLFLPTNHRLTVKHIELINEKVIFTGYPLVLHRSVRDNISMIWFLYKHFNAINPAIIHIQANGHKWFWLMYVLTLFKEIKYINTIHDPKFHIGDLRSIQFKNTWSKLFSRIFCKAYIVHGQALKGDLHAYYRIPLNKIEVIHHGHFAIYKEFRERTYSDEDYTVLFFGRIWPYKGLDVFIKASNRVFSRFKSVKFIIAGEGEDITKYTKLIEDQSAFEIRNYRVSLAETDRLFQRATIVVLPYIEATQSGVIPAAFAYEKPVIASRVGSLHEIVQDGKNGLLVTPGDVEELCSKILELLLDRERRVHMKGEIRKTIENEMNWQQIAKNTYDLYCRTLKN